MAGRWGNPAARALRVLQPAGRAGVLPVPLRQQLGGRSREAIKGAGGNELVQARLPAEVHPCRQCRRGRACAPTTTSTTTAAGASRHSAGCRPCPLASSLRRACMHGRRGAACHTTARANAPTPKHQKSGPDTGSQWPGMILTGRALRTSHTISTSSKPPLTCRPATGAEAHDSERQASRSPTAAAACTHGPERLVCEVGRACQHPPAGWRQR